MSRARSSLGTGTFRSQRQLLGLTLRWSYAPGEIKVLTSADGGNFQESVGWSQLSRSEPSFEDTCLVPGASGRESCQSANA